MGVDIGRLERKRGRAEVVAGKEMCCPGKNGPQAALRRASVNVFASFVLCSSFHSFSFISFSFGCSLAGDALTHARTVCLFRDAHGDKSPALE